MSGTKTKAECPAGAGAKGLAKECAKGYQHSLSQQEARTREARQLKTYYSLQEDRPDVKVKLSSKLRENFSQYSKEAPTWLGPSSCGKRLLDTQRIQTLLSSNIVSLTALQGCRYEEQPRQQERGPGQQVQGDLHRGRGRLEPASGAEARHQEEARVQAAGGLQEAPEAALQTLGLRCQPQLKLAVRTVAVLFGSIKSETLLVEVNSF